MTTHQFPRVLMFVPQYPYPVVGGLERQSHELAKALLKRGVAVQVLSGKISSSQPGFESVEGVLVTRISWATWKPWRFLRGPLDIAFALWRARFTYDVIHLHQQSWVGLFVILVTKLLRKPILTKLPNVGDYGIPGLRGKPLGQLRLAILLSSDGIVAMSWQSVAELREAGYPNENILTVPNGIALGSPQEMCGKDKALCRVVFVGRLIEQKRLDTLLDAWQQVIEMVGTVARLELWGDGPQAAELRQQCEQLGIGTSVVFCGHVDNVRERLRSVDIFVLPSRVEGNSNAVLEAMDAGLPIIATPVGGTLMQVGREGAPLLFDVGDSVSLAQRLLLLIQDANLRSQYGEYMRQRARCYFDIDEVADAYHAAYTCLARNSANNLNVCGKLPD